MGYDAREGGVGVSQVSVIHIISIVGIRCKDDGIRNGLIPLAFHRNRFRLFMLCSIEAFRPRRHWFRTYVYPVR